MSWEPGLVKTRDGRDLEVSGSQMGNCVYLLIDGEHVGWDKRLQFDHDEIETLITYLELARDYVWSS